MHNHLSAIEVARYVRLFEPVSTSTLAELMQRPQRQMHNAVMLASRLGFIRRLPGDMRWRVVRVG